MIIINIGGMIGVGKTTYIKNKLKEDKLKGLKSKAVYELFEPEQNSTNIYKEYTTRDKIMDLFLEMYYNNVHNLESNDQLKRSVAYNVTLGHQVNFLANRSSKIIDAISIAKKENLDILYLDRTIFEDLIFTKRNLFNNQTYWYGYMKVWDKWINLINYAIGDNELENIILTAPTETILKRIKKRGRENEQKKELTEYFTNLNEIYDKELTDRMIEFGWKFKIIENGSD